MPDSLTTFFGITKPALHSTGWGPKANTDFDQEDLIFGIPRAAFKAPTIGATTTLDFSLGSAFLFTLTQATTIAFANPAANPAGVTTQVWQEVKLLVVGDGTRRVITWPVAVSWLSGQVPVLTPGGSDYFSFFTKDNGVTWLGVHQTVLDLPPTTTDTYVPSGTTNIDLATGRFHKYTVVTGASTIAFINNTQNTPSFRLTITNGGLFTQTWPGSVVWLNGFAPTLQSAGVDELEFTTPDGGATWYGARLDPKIVASRNRCKAIMSVDQTIGNNVEAALTFQGADVYDLGPSSPLHSSVTNPTRILAGVITGVLMIVGQAIWSVATTDGVRLRIRKNGTTIIASHSFTTGSAGAQKPILQVVAFDNAPAPTDYYELLAFADGAGGNIVQASDTFFATQDLS